MKQWRHLFLILAAGRLACWSAVDFNREIRPILSDNCFACHGPDESKRASKLRLDLEAGAKVDLGGRRAIVPGKPEQSELIRRITSVDAHVRMPPSHSGRTLTSAQIDQIRLWILEGAQWQAHWAFVRPQRPTLPAVRNSEWARNAIDRFVLQRLEREGLEPSPEAGRGTLIRRVTLDLTGLPPTTAEVGAFLGDSAPGAYERLVGRLLASPRYGERMAGPWLAAARYADTNGYQSDGERFMWRWRDWVIDAFNRNLPYDQFVMKQIAGDMLPDATLEDKIATGFNRNHRGNGEGGVIADEYAVEYVVDRVETTSAVFLGLTMGCARCHDHKYDPVSPKEFYRMFAYFNNVPERGRANKYGNSPPLISAPMPDQITKLGILDEKVSAAKVAFENLKEQAGTAQQAWEQLVAKDPTELQWMKRDGLAKYLPLDGVVASPAGNATRFDGTSFVDAGDVGNFGFYDKFTLSAWINPASGDGPIVTRTREVAHASGYGLYLAGGKLQFNLVLRWLDDALRVETERKLELNKWHHVAASYDGSRSVEGVKMYIDGQPVKLTVLLDDLNQSFQVKEPLRIGAGGPPDYRFRGSIDEVMVWRGVLADDEISAVADPYSLKTIANLPAMKRSKTQSKKLAWHFLENAAPQEVQETWRAFVAAQEERKTFADSLPTVMVMKERETPQDTFLLVRGSYLRRGEKVTPGVPAFLPDLPSGAPNNRLGLAKWLVDGSNPLTARVMVNRLWQMYFGVGLVKSVEDFGSQGEWPSNPALLDWLATEFISSGWDLKEMNRLIVTSATYRQSSKVSPALSARDPENRLMARGPRLRLSAEMVRDQALAVSGLLVDKVGGPSVKPYQPAGLWKELSGGQDYKQDHGPSLYRRSLYTFWKRAAPPPGMMLFDAAGREACTVRETRTNTPLQALAVMNDVTYLEAARALAERTMNEVGGPPLIRLAAMFRRVLARIPKPGELDVLQRQFEYYSKNGFPSTEAARKYVSYGESPRDEKLPPRELATYTVMASMILNLDETIAKD
jgi:hypothetical protein